MLQLPPKRSASRRYSRSEAGLYFPVRTTLKGRARWQVLDERGVPEIPRNPSGFAIGPVEGVEQPNLITNLGLDTYGVETGAGWCPLGYDLTTGTQARDGFRRFLAVGTGSTAPDVTDTTLDAEAQRASSSGAYGNGSWTYTHDTVTAQSFKLDALVRRVVTMNADRNLTEWGLNHATGTAVNIRELFRDELGDPVTISLLNGKSVLLSHTLTAEISTAGASGSINIEVYDAANVLVDTIPINAVWGPICDSTANALHFWSRAVVPFFNSDDVVYAASARAYNPTSTVAWTSAGTNTKSVTTYGTGTYQRTRRVTVSAGNANAAWHAFRIGPSQTIHWYGLACHFDGDSYTKLSSDTLRVGFTLSWARATEGS